MLGYSNWPHLLLLINNKSSVHIIIFTCQFSLQAGSNTGKKVSTKELKSVITRVPEFLLVILAHKITRQSCWRALRGSYFGYGLYRRKYYFGRGLYNLGCGLCWRKYNLGCGQASSQHGFSPSFALNYSTESFGCTVMYKHYLGHV